MRRCQIMIQFECGKTSFFKCQKKETLMHKINSKWYCWMYGPRILQKNSPDHLFQVIRWSGAVLTFCSPKKLLFLQKSLFLDGAHVRIINLFIKKITHRLSKLPQPYCRLFVSPLSCLPAAYQPLRFTFLGCIWNRWPHYILSIFRVNFVHFSSSLSRSTRTLWNE